MPDDVMDDDTDFDVPTVPEKDPKTGRFLPRNSNAAEPTPKVPKEPVTPKPKVADAPAASRFHPRMVRLAEEYGIPPEEIEACETRAELQWLIDQEKAAVGEIRQAQTGRVKTGSDGSPQSTDATASPAPPIAKANPVPEPEAEWEFEKIGKPEAGYDQDLLADLKKMGKAILKGGKGEVTKADLAEIVEKLNGIATTVQAINAANDPMVKRAKGVIAKYPNLFGDVFDDNGAPPDGTDERVRFNTLVGYANQKIQAGEFDKTKPEREIPAAIKTLFGVDTPGAIQVSPHIQAALPDAIKKRVVAPPATNGKGQKAQEWDEAGQAAPTSRNGAEKTGIPSDDGAKKEINKYLRKHGMPTEVATEDDDMDDF